MSGICGLSTATAGFVSFCILGGEVEPLLTLLVEVSEEGSTTTDDAGGKTADLRLACFRLNSANQSGFLADCSSLIVSDVIGADELVGLLLSSEDLLRGAEGFFSPLLDVGFRFPRAS